MNFGYDLLKYVLMFVNDCRVGRNYFSEVISVVYSLLWVDFFKVEFILKVLGIIEGLRRKKKERVFFIF